MRNNEESLDNAEVTIIGSRADNSEIISGGRIALIEFLEIIDVGKYTSVKSAHNGRLSTLVDGKSAHCEAGRIIEMHLTN